MSVQQPLRRSGDMSKEAHSFCSNHNVFRLSELKIASKLTNSSRSVLLSASHPSHSDQPLVVKMSLQSLESMNEALFYLSTLPSTCNIKMELKHLPSKYPLLQHPHITPCRGIEVTDKHVCILMDKIPSGDALKFVQSTRKGFLSEAQARTILIQLIDVLSYLHRSGVVHRDIKLENLLMGDQMKVFLSDFEYSCPFRSGVFLNERCGTPLCAPPEMYRRKYIGPEVDVWSTGVLLYNMVCGCFPFTQDQLERFGSIPISLAEQEVQSALKFPSYVSKEFISLVRKIFTVRVEERPTIDQVLMQPWVQRRRLTGSQIAILSALGNLRNNQPPSPPETPNMILSPCTSKEMVALSMANVGYVSPTKLSPK